MCGDGKQSYRRADSDTRPRTPLELWEASEMNPDNCRQQKEKVVQE